MTVNGWKKANTITPYDKLIFDMFKEYNLKERISLLPYFKNLNIRIVNKEQVFFKLKPYLDKTKESIREISKKLQIEENKLYHYEIVFN